MVWNTPLQMRVVSSGTRTEEPKRCAGKFGLSLLRESHCQVLDRGVTQRDLL